MKVFISFGPAAGAVVLAVYAAVMRIGVMVKGEKLPVDKFKKIYKLMIAVEIVLCAIALFVPLVTGKSYLPDGATRGGVLVNTDNKFKVSYIESNRGYSNTLVLDEEELRNVRVKCSCDEGKAFLRILQDKTLKELDITGTDSLLDMTDFNPGRITFTVLNDGGRNVDFELLFR